MVASLKHDGSKSFAQRFYDADGTGLALNIRPEGSKSWIQGLTVHGRRRYIGLGPYPLVSLQQARKKALKNKQIALEGGDPIAERDENRLRPDFKTLAKQTIARQCLERRNPKFRQHWESSLARYAYPQIGRKRIDTITVSDIRACVEPIWGTKRETATKVLRRISAVIEDAIADGHREDNPAQKAKSRLPKRRPGVRHHRALPWSEVPEAIQIIQGTSAWIGTRLAFEFLVLTAARSGEVRGATWDEISFENAIWTIPPDRMKTGVEHRVPLSKRCIEILREARELTDPPRTRELRGCKLVFPSLTGRTLSDSTISKLVRENNIQAVPHGFRSSFRDWAAEETSTPHAVMEAALAHVIPSAVERAYARSDLMNKRRDLMEAWAEYCGGAS